MYGTVARMKLKTGSEQKMLDLLEEFRQARIPGYKGEILYRSDGDANEYYMAVVFDSKDAYLANAGSPEMDERYRKYRALLDTDPEWHDGTIVHSHV